MKKYQHYSFDLWQTLIRSNAGFKNVRANYLFSNFNPNGYSQNEIMEKVSGIALMCDKVSESTEMSIHPIQMYAMALQKLGFNLDNVKEIDLISILNVMHARFLSTPPPIYDNDTELVLRQLKSEGATISITSNTGFVPGGTLRQYLSNMGLARYIDFYIFSDEVGVCKPSQLIFNKMILQAQQKTNLRGRGMLHPRDIVHVGDNLKTDIRGAENCGIAAVHVHGSTGLTLKSLL